MKLFPAIFLSVLLIGNQLPCRAQDSLNYKSLGPYDFHLAYLKAEKSMLIDVREVFEFRRSRLRESINIPSSWNMKPFADTIDVQSALFLYCTTGFRSKRVAEFFCKKGFRKVYSLDGGIVAWRKEGMPVEKRKKKRLPE